MQLHFLSCEEVHGVEGTKNKPGSGVFGQALHDVAIHASAKNLVFWINGTIHHDIVSFLIPVKVENSKKLKANFCLLLSSTHFSKYFKIS